MKKGINIYSSRHIFSSVLMLFAIAWLTVSLPFINESKQLLKVYGNTSQNYPAPVEEDTNPFANTTEEKTESGNNSLSEYLHEFNVHQNHFRIVETYYKCHPSDLYLAFHPELNIPPPKA